MITIMNMIANPKNKNIRGVRSNPSTILCTPLTATFYFSIHVLVCNIDELGYNNGELQPGTKPQLVLAGDGSFTAFVFHTQFLNPETEGAGIDLKHFGRPAFS